MTEKLTQALGRGLLARDHQDRILIAGTHRSGTTWLGNVLGRCPDTLVVHEPFSKDHGIRGVDRWFICSERDNRRNLKLLDKFFLTRNTRYRAFQPGRGRKEAIKRLFTDDDNQQILRRAWTHPPRRLLVKDPLASMAAGHLIRAFDFKVVVTVKHPFAFYDSLLRVGWHRSLPILDLEAQVPGLLGDYRALRKDSNASQAGAVWAAINGEALQLLAEHPDNVLISLHEDLCEKPDVELERITDFLGIPYNKPMIDYVASTTSATAVRPTADVIHDFKRNSADLPQRWRASLSEQDCKDIAARVRPVAEALYPAL